MGINSVFWIIRLLLYWNSFKWVYGNLLLNKPSTHSKGNDNSTYCFYSTNAALPYWQVDLQGYFHIDHVSIQTCWGSWGNKAKSAEIEGFFSNPETCVGAEGFLYGTTPSNTGELQTHAFTSTVPFGVRYLRVSATLIAELSLPEVTATGTSFRKSAKSSFAGANNKRVASVANTTRADSAVSCSLFCHKMDNCLAFSFNPDEELSCILSDCATTDDVAGWRTMTLDLREAFTANSCSSP